MLSEKDVMEIRKKFPPLDDPLFDPIFTTKVEENPVYSMGFKERNAVVEHIVKQINSEAKKDNSQ